MSGHFSRLNYDQCFINEDTKQSTAPGDYRLYNGQANNEKSCHSLFGPRSNRVKNSAEVNKGATLGDRAEIESVLSNRGEASHRCSGNRKLDDKRKKLADNLQKSVYCNNFLHPSNSRLEVPIDEFRGLSTLPLQISYPLIDPKENVFNGHNTTSLQNQDVNSRTGANTRLEAKDKYAAKF